jgi:hypothetical protein
MVDNHLIARNDERCYEEACNALARCVDLDEAKYWSDKADALAAWAKIYHDTKIEDQARKLKAKARRSMALLAEALRPTKKTQSHLARCSADGCDLPPTARNSGFCWRHYNQRAKSGLLASRSAAASGARSLVIEKGLTATDASNAMALSRLPGRVFDRAVERGESLTNLYRLGRGLGKSNVGARSDSFIWLCSNEVTNGPNLARVRNKFREKSAKEVAAGISGKDAQDARGLVIEIQEWLDEFEQCLPKQQDA